MDEAEPGRLTRERIVEAAVRLVESDGLSSLSMRRLGGALGVEAMALYRYIDGRDDLLEAMVDALADKVPRAADMDLRPGGSWQAYLQELAHAVRDLAREHPRIFPLLVTRPPAAPWLRPPLRSVDLVEDFLGALTSRGLSDAQAVSAYRSFTSFLLGALLLAVTEEGASLPAEEILGGASGAPDLSPGEHPHLTRMREMLTEDHANEEFESALERLLEDLAGEFGR